MELAIARERPAPYHTHNGMTLVEVCVGLFLFTLVAGGFLGSLIQARRMSIAALYESSALTSAEGYMEQMKTINYGAMLLSEKSASSPQPIPTVTGTGAPDPLTPSTDTTNNINTRTIDIFGRYNQQTPPAGAKDVMKMTFVVKVTNLSAAADDERLLIQLSYTWSTPYVSSSATRSGSLAFIRSNIQSFVNLTNVN